MVWALINPQKKKEKKKWYKYILYIYPVYCLVGYSLPTLHTCPLNKRKKKKGRWWAAGRATIIWSEWVRGRKTSRKQVDRDRLPNNYFLVTKVGNSSKPPPPPPPPLSLFSLFRELDWISWRWTSGLLHETL